MITITDHGFTDLAQERSIIEGAGHQLVVAQCRTEDEVIAAAAEADALLVQWAPIPRRVIEQLNRCRLIVRYGIGFDNVDVEAANERGIAVCNVPDYCIDEVADHTVALTLALARQLRAIDDRVRDGVWRIVPDRPMPAMSSMTFGTLGLGRVARAVHARVAPFGFRSIAHDPHLGDTDTLPAIEMVSFERLVADSDVISLHAPLTAQTRGLFGKEVLGAMKRGALIVNTGRGGLIDLDALVDQLESDHLGGAGLDVFEEEPLPVTHPVRTAPNVILTSHVAWYSEASVPRLQRMAAEEIVRGLSGAPLHNPVGRLQAVAQ